MTGQPTFEVYSMPLVDTSNKYFELWRAALEATGRIELKPVRGTLWGPVFAPRGGDTRIVCIHWSTALYGSAYALKSIALLAVNFIALWLLKLRGTKVVWVIHNAYAHDYPHPAIDRIGRALLARFADALVAQQESTRRMLTARYPAKKVVYIPHGNYIGAYGPQVARAAARARFGFVDSEVVLLALGALRPYKRIEKIIDAVVQTSDPKLRLWIAGKGDAAYAAALCERTHEPRVRLDNAFVPGEDIPAYLAAADYSIFYYDDSELTSGALVLSLSYGTPVITRRINAAEVVGTAQGLVFDTDDELRAILSGPLNAQHDPDEVAATVALHPWVEVARRTLALYTEL